MKKAVIIRTNGTTETIDISTDTLDKLQGAVGGWVQAIDLSDTITMWLNEEGKVEGLPHNETAQWYWDMAFGPDTDYIVGDIVFTGGVDAQGDTLGLDDKTVETLSNTKELRLA
jgi:hypothetical protein